MKKILFFLLTVFLAEISFSQEDFSFVDDDMEWTYIVEENEEMWQFKIPTIETVRYKYDEDTIINAILYKKMLKSSDNGKSWKVLGYFREENKNVYFICKDKIEEKLAYNFSNNIGYRFDSNYEITLISDSIVVNSMKKARWGFYKKMNEDDDSFIPLDYKDEYLDIIIEDIGSIFSPTFDMLPFIPGGYTGARYYTSLLCVQKGKDVIWHNPNYEECYYERTAIESFETVQHSISPNPVNDFLTLTLPTDNNGIKIFDLQGKLLLQQNVGFSAEINVSMLQAGTYVLVVNEESYKFVKE